MCGAAGGAGRTGIVSSMVELRLAILSSLGHERTVEVRLLLEKRLFAHPKTCTAGFEWRANALFVLVEQSKCVSSRANEARERARGV